MDTAVMVAVADADPVVTITERGTALARWCVMCRVHADIRGGPRPHAEGCGWRRANEVIGRRPVALIEPPTVTPTADNHT
jgi:hypothetical protein